MQLTNVHGLPEPLARAIMRDPYNPGRANISVTQLISPPRIRQLRLRHRHEIEVDVTDMLWALMGQAVHHVLERGVTLEDQEIAEERLFMKVNGWVVSGQNDLWTPPDELDDYKFTSVWSMLLGDKPEWEAQLNCLAALYRDAGFPVNHLYITTIYRDFSKAKAKQGGNYPKVGAQRHPIKVWPHQQVLDYMAERVELHRMAQDMPDDQLPPCTPQERWAREDTWAVVKKGNKRATKVCSSLSEARQKVIELTRDKGAEYEIQHRPGLSVRCADYCEVAPFCNQWAAENKE